MSTTKSAYSKARRKRFRLYAVRAIILSITGFSLELSTSTFADWIRVEWMKSDVWGLTVIIVAALGVSLILNFYKAKKAHPIYSMDNDFSVWLFVFFAVSGAFLENLLAGIISDKLSETGYWKNIIAVISLVIAICGIISDVIVIDGLYEKSRFIDYDYVKNKVKKWAEGYVKAVFRVNAAWIVVPVLTAALCGAWMAFVILR